MGVAYERGPAREGVADRRSRIGLAGELRESLFEPAMQSVEQRSCPGLSDGSADLWCAAADLGFDGVKGSDALDGFRRDG